MQIRVNIEVPPCQSGKVQIHKVLKHEAAVLVSHVATLSPGQSMELTTESTANLQIEVVD